MTFIRPEVREMLWRWREVAFCALIILFGVRQFALGLTSSSITQTVLGVLITALFTLLMFWAILRAKLYKPTRAAGVVEVKEREVGYLSSDGGAFVSLDDLTRLEIVTGAHSTEDDTTFWVLTHLGGPPLAIPASAKGSDQLFDAFAALPKVDFETAAHAINQNSKSRFLIWEKHTMH